MFAEVEYRAHARVARHTHDLAGLAIVVDGGYSKRMGGTAHDCRPGTMTIEPPGFTHAETYGRLDVRALLIEILPWRLDMMADAAPVVRVPMCGRDSASRALGRRVWRELGATDSASSLVLEALALESVAVADRAAERGAAAPDWLARVTERLRDELRGDIGLSSLAADAGVHPAHLARVFRAREGCSVGEFARRCRIEWAASQLTMTSASLSALAHAAGFCDQSHFTRVFTRHLGMSPGRYRTMGANRRPGVA